MKIGKKLRILRKNRKMTLKELSEKSGVQIATLSRIEHDIMTGTLDSHMSICKALGISLSEFYREIEEEQKTVAVSKRSEEHQSFVHQKKSTTEILTSKIMGRKMMPLLMRIQSGGESHKEENKVGTEKFIYILDGKIEARIGKEIYSLSKGDSIYFDASLAHVFKNISKGGASVLCILTPPAF